MEKFIVEIEPNLFLVTIKNKKQLILTPFLSRAAHLPFTFASEVCHMLQNRGYSHAVVCTYRGEPVTRRLLYTTMQNEDGSVAASAGA